MTAPRGEGEGRYLKVKVLDFLDRRLAGGGISWRQLAGELNFTSVDVDKFESDGLKIGQSSTRLLLRNWEYREGGCNVEKLKESLKEIGRRDILRDLRDDYEEQGIELVESRSSPTTKRITGIELVESRSSPTTILQIPQDGQDKRYTGIELVESNSRPTTMRQKQQGGQEVVFIGTMYNVGESQLRDKRNSDPDPVIRKDLSTSADQSWGSGSMDSIPRSNSPKNFKKTRSAQLSEEPRQIPCIKTPPIPQEAQREEELYQTRRDYGPLRSVPYSVRDASEHGEACPGKQYLVVSSNDEQDRLWSKKLCKILNKKGHLASWLHEVPNGRYRGLFHQVQYVLVIYTEKYKKDFQTAGTRNQILFQEMQIEYQTNFRVNRRFIPVYDVAQIRLLPDALLNGNAAERNYILNLLSSKHPREGSCMHSSAPSRGTPTDAPPIKENNRHLSKSQPVILREYHSPQNHAKPVNSEKKGQLSKYFGHKNKKGK